MKYGDLACIPKKNRDKYGDFACFKKNTDTNMVILLVLKRDNRQPKSSTYFKR